MKKHLIVIGIIALLLAVGLSGCVDNVNRAASDTGTCCVLGIIGLVFFIILIAYLLGGKKTVVQTQQSSPAPIPAPIIIHKETPPPKREKEKSKPERRCPECGRVIPDDAEMCPYCGKKFTLFSDTPASNIYQKVKDFKEGKSSNQDYSVLEEKESKKNEDNKTEVDKETEEKEKKKERFCFECGAKLEGSPKFCPMCGTKQEES